MFDFKRALLMVGNYGVVCAGIELSEEELQCFVYRCFARLMQPTWRIGSCEHTTSPYHRHSCFGTQNVPLAIQLHRRWDDQKLLHDTQNLIRDHHERCSSDADEKY